MKLKKVLMFVCLVLVVTLFTGCTKEEKDLFKLTNEINNLDNVKQELELKLDLTGVKNLIKYANKYEDLKMPEDLKKKVEVFEKYFDNTKFSIVSRVNKDTMSGEMLMYEVDSHNKKTLITTIYIDKLDVYMNIRQLYEFVQKFEEKVLSEVEGLTLNLDKIRLIDGVDYVKVSNASKETLEKIGMKDINVDLYNKTYELIMNKLLDGYSTKNVKKLGKNKYSIKYTGYEILEDIIRLVEYVSNNEQKTIDTIYEITKLYTDKEVSKEEFDKVSKEQIETNKQQILTYINTLKLLKDTPQYKQILDSIYFEYEVSKVNNEYRINFEYGIDLTAIFNASIESRMANTNIKKITGENKVRVLCKSTCKKCDLVKVEIPQKYITDEMFGLFNKRTLKVNIDSGEFKYDILGSRNEQFRKEMEEMDKRMLESAAMRYQLENTEVKGDITDEIMASRYVLGKDTLKNYKVIVDENGKVQVIKINEKLDIKLIDGSSYLPLRDVLEKLGEQVKWDNEQQKAYVDRGSEKVYMTAKLIGEKTYVKVRELATLGYKVDWNNETRQTIISW